MYVYMFSNISTCNFRRSYLYEKCIVIIIIIVEFFRCISSYVTRMILNYYFFCSSISNLKPTYVFLASMQSIAWFWLTTHIICSNLYNSIYYATIHTLLKIQLLNHSILLWNSIPVVGYIMSWFSILNSSICCV